MPGMRPRKATCGRAAVAKSTNIDATTASSTPFSIPNKSTPISATIAMLNSNRLTCHKCRKAARSISPRTATRTIAANTTIGRLCKRPVKNSKQIPIVADANTSASGVRAPALSFTADCESPPAIGNP